MPKSENAISKQQAEEFAREWITAWNAHDLERIMAHYAEDVEFTSPFAIRLMGTPDGTIRGKAQLRAYFQKALQAYPELHFDLMHVLASVQSVTLVYRSVNNLLAAEVMFFDANGQVTQVAAHYAGG